MKKLLTLAALLLFVGFSFAFDSNADPPDEKTTIEKVMEKNDQFKALGWQPVLVVQNENEAGIFVSVKYSQGNTELVYCSAILEDGTEANIEKLKDSILGSSGGEPYKQLPGSKTQVAFEYITNGGAGGIPA